MTFSYQSFVVKAIILSGRSRGGARAREKIFLETVPPPYLRVYITGTLPPLPLSKGLDPPVILSIKLTDATGC